MRKRYNLFYIRVLMFQALFCYSGYCGIPDSLKSKDFDYFTSGINDPHQPLSKRLLYADWYLTKAKLEHDWEEVLYAYKEKLHLSPKGHRLVYSDSMLAAAYQSKDKSLIGSAYLTKGIVYYDAKKYRQALNNYLLANEALSETDDKYLLHKVKFNMAQLKYFVGKYNKAAQLFRECITYFEKEDKEPYISTLHSLSMCYIRMAQYELCTATNELGLKESIREGQSEMIPYFIHSEGINQYFRANYPVAIKKLTQITPYLVAKNDFANKAVSDYYIGKSYIQLKEINKALPYFMQIDTAFRVRHFMREDFRDGYKILIAHHKANDNKDLQILYTDRLLKADSLLDMNEKYVSGKLSDSYDHKTLVDSNNKLKESLRKQDMWYAIGYYILIPALLFFSGFLLYRHKRNKRQYRKNYEELIQKRTATKPPQAIKKEKGGDELSDISPELINSILAQLQKFEESKKFKGKGMTQVKLASMFNSNTSYISRIVAYHKGERFTDYINNLKIDYIVSLLESESRYRNYSNRALADEAGFNTTQHFVTAFRKRTKISPSYFVEQWKKDNC